MEIRIGVIEAEMVEPGKFKFRVYIQLDISFPIFMIPGGVLGFVSKKIVGKVFESLIAKSNVVMGSVWEERVKKDEKGFYKLVGEKEVRMRERVMQHRL